MDVPIAATKNNWRNEMKDSYKVTVTFKDGHTKEKIFDNAYKAGCFHDYYDRLYPDPKKPDRHVIRVHSGRYVQKT